MAIELKKWNGEEVQGWMENYNNNNDKLVEAIGEGGGGGEPEGYEELVETVENNTNNIQQLGESVENNTNDIQNINNSLTNQSARITNNTNNIQQLNTSIENINSNLTTQSALITNINTRVMKNTNDIAKINNWTNISLSHVYFSNINSTLQFMQFIRNDIVILQLMSTSFNAVVNELHNKTGQSEPNALSTLPLNIPKGYIPRELYPQQILLYDATNLTGYVYLNKGVNKFNYSVEIYGKELAIGTDSIAVSPYVLIPLEPE